MEKYLEPIGGISIEFYAKLCALMMHTDGDEQKERGENDERDKGEDEIDYSLDPVCGVGDGPRQVHKGRKVRVIHRDLSEVLLGILGKAVDLHPFDL